MSQRDWRGARGDGVPNWVFADTGGDTDSSVAIFNTGFECCNPVDRIVVSSNGNTGLLTLNFNGTQFWKTLFEKDQSLNSTPAIDTDGDVLIGANDGKIRLISSTGAVVWSFTADSTHIRGSAALALLSRGSDLTGLGRRRLRPVSSLQQHS